MLKHVKYVVCFCIGVGGVSTQGIVLHFSSASSTACLYPSLVGDLIQFIHKKCKEKAIQLIVTSNAPTVFDIFETRRIVLSPLSPELIHFDSHTAEFLRITASLVPTKPVLFLDGPTDKYFIKTYFPDWPKKFNLIFGELNSCKFFVEKYAKPLNIRVAYLKDKELFHPDLIEEKRKFDEASGGAKIFYWSLPCIESFLILHWCLIKPEEAKKTVATYLQSLNRATEYYIGLTVGIKVIIEELSKKNIVRNNIDLGECNFSPKLCKIGVRS